MAQPVYASDCWRREARRLSREQTVLCLAFPAVAWVVDRRLEADLADLILRVYAKVAHRRAASFAGWAVLAWARPVA